MRIKFLFIIVLCLFGINGYSQITYSGRIETGYSLYLFRSSYVDPGPDWLGYYLNEEQDGIEINLINGVQLGKIFDAGVGIGYLNYKGIDGISLFLNLGRPPKEKKLSSLLNFKIGYNHIWNQYENGSGTGLAEFDAGAYYRFSDRRAIYLQTGLAVTLEAFFIPIKLGLRF